MPYSKILIVIAFVLAFLAALVGGGVISINAGNAWEWLTSGSLAAFFLAALV